MPSGTIKRIVREKGFGFIRGDRGDEYFFHRSGIEGDFDRLSEGQAVTFEEEPSQKGLRAGHVRAQQHSAA
jgi:CspA family cold shock protein